MDLINMCWSKIFKVMHGSNKPTKSIIQALYALWKTLSMQTENNSVMINLARYMWECCSWQMLLFMEVSSTALILLLTLVAPQRT